MSSTMIPEKIPIGRFSMITRLTCKALRLYDETGLLSPAVKDRFTGYQYYQVSQIERGVMIRSLVDLGFPLAQIIEVLKAKEQEMTVLWHSSFRSNESGYLPRSNGYNPLITFCKDSRWRCFL